MENGVMKRCLLLSFSSLLAAFCVAPAAAQGSWTLSADAGMCFGNQTDLSFAWWGALHRWMTPNFGLGVEAGRHRWEGQDLGRGNSVSLRGFPGDYIILARRGQQLP